MGWSPIFGRSSVALLKKTISCVNKPGGTMRHSASRRDMEWGRILVELWALCLHHNERIFKGRPALTNGSFRKWRDLCHAGVEG